jgi:hypothetical protein
MYIKILNEHEIRLIYGKIDRTNPIHAELLNALFVNIKRKVYLMSDKKDVIDLLNVIILI